MRLIHFALSLFLFLSLFAVTDQSWAGEKEVIFFLRGTKEDDPEKKSRDHKWDAFASKQFSKILGAADSEASIRTLFVPSLEKLDEQIIAALNPDESLRGLILMGHGGYDFFYMSTIDWEKKNGLDGKELGVALANIAKSGRASPDLFCYSNACSNFYRVEKGGLASDLANELKLLTEGESPVLRRVDLLGHRGMAAFGEWLPAFWIDRLYARRKTDTPAYSYYAVVDMYGKFLFNGLILGNVLGYGYWVLDTSRGVNPWLLASSLPYFLGYSLELSLRFHYIAKSGRHIVLSNGQAYLNARDGDVWIRDGLKAILLPIERCREILASWGALTIKPMSAP